MSIDGWYKVQFGAALRGAGGIIRLRNGDIAGADDQYLYEGSYKLSGDQISAKIIVAAYAPNAISVFNTHGGQFELNLTGSYQASAFVLHGKSPVGGADIHVAGTQIGPLRLTTA